MIFICIEYTTNITERKVGADLSRSPPIMIFNNQDPSWLRAPGGHVILSASEGSHPARTGFLIDR
jgi:hypothetical protein